MQADPRAVSLFAAFAVTAIVTDHWIALVIMWLYLAYAIDVLPSIHFRRK